ncbi:MAG: outer membrane protein assembly factor BamE [Duncaniella sp.]|nr:outer membrane protein assembly factor BamE [Duncaniella sp.]
MAESAARYSGEPASHWTEIRDKKVTPGMTELEVKLAIGQPVTTRKGSDRDRWIYPMNFVVLFENGKVVRIVE